MTDETKKKQALDITACRAARPYSRREYIGRVLWALIRPLFRFSPRAMFGWRCALLRLFGANVGRNTHIYPTAQIYLPWNLTIGDNSSIGEWALVYNLGPVSIGAGATISHRTHLCAGTHEYSNPELPLLRVPINIGDQAWICADAIVGPSVRVGEGAIVGAGSVAVKDIDAWSIVAGNPAKFIKKRTMELST